MLQLLSFVAFFLSTFATAQDTSTSKFTNTWLGDYVVGLAYQISWTVGDGRPVSLTTSNDTWSQDLTSFLPPQTTTSFNWTVPSSLSYLSTYAITLDQNGPGRDVSPPFSIVGPVTAQNISSTTSLPLPTSQNATMAMNGTILTLTPGCTATGAAVATSTYWDTSCGCMKTAVGPAPASGRAGGFNYTLAPMTGGSGASGPTASLYSPGQHGGAARLDVPWGKVGLFGMGVVAVTSAFIIA